MQVTHKIDAETDIERDHIVETLRASHPAVVVEVLEDFATGYHSRNGGGDTIVTDGDLPVVDVRGVSVPDVESDDASDAAPDVASDAASDAASQRGRA